MRTTLNIDDDVLRAARSLADEERKSLGAVVSDLIRRALTPDDRTRYQGAFPVFRVREGTPPLTPEMVARALDEE
ncbi:MAG: antitoxin [Gemmatimonadota bacterium]|jgi:hypothetical protein